MSLEDDIKKASKKADELKKQAAEAKKKVEDAGKAASDMKNKTEGKPSPSVIEQILTLR